MDLLQLRAPVPETDKLCLENTSADFQQWAAEVEADKDELAETDWPGFQWCVDEDMPLRTLAYYWNASAPLPSVRDVVEAIEEGMGISAAEARMACFLSA